MSSITNAPARASPLDRSPSNNIVGRVAALLEVLAAFVVVHVSYRSFKHFTELGKLEGSAGLNFSTGTTMIVFTALAAFRQLSHMRNANEISAFTATIARWQTPDVEEATRFIIHDLPALMNDPAFLAELRAERLSERVAKMRPVANLMDEVDVLLIQGIVTEGAVMMNYASDVIHLWALSEPAPIAVLKALL